MCFCKNPSIVNWLVNGFMYLWKSDQYELINESNHDVKNSFSKTLTKDFVQETYDVFQRLISTFKKAFNLIKLVWEQ